MVMKKILLLFVMLVGLLGCVHKAPTWSPEFGQGQHYMSYAGLFLATDGAHVYAFVHPEATTNGITTPECWHRIGEGGKNYKRDLESMIHTNNAPTFLVR